MSYASQEQMSAYGAPTICVLALLTAYRTGTRAADVGYTGVPPTVRVGEFGFIIVLREIATTTFL